MVRPTLRERLGLPPRAKRSTAKKNNGAIVSTARTSTSQPINSSPPSRPSKSLWNAAGRQIASRGLSPHQRHASRKTASKDPFASTETSASEPPSKPSLQSKASSVQNSPRQLVLLEAQKALTDASGSNNDSTVKSDSSATPSLPEEHDGVAGLWRYFTDFSR